MPPILGAAHLIGDLFNPGECGITVAGAMGAIPLTHEAVRNWMENTRVWRAPWEIRFLIRLSFEYLAEQMKAKKRDAKPPWMDEVSEDDLRAVASGLRAAIKRMAA
jgi:hypothetical protein